MPARLSVPLINRIRDMRRTMSLEAIRRETGVCLKSIRYYTDDVELARCDCGRPFNHAGNCRPRHQASESRQETARRFVAGRRRWSDEAHALLKQLWEAGIAEQEIVERVSFVLERDDITVASVVVRAHRFGFRRSREYLSRMRSETLLRKHHGADVVALEAARAKRAHVQAVLGSRPPRCGMPPAEVQAIWHDTSLSAEDAAQRVGHCVRWLYRRYGPRFHRPTPPPAPPARTRGFSMSAMSMPDPIIALRLAAAAQQSRGSLTPVLGHIKQSAGGAD